MLALVTRKTAEWLIYPKIICCVTWYGPLYTNLSLFTLFSSQILSFLLSAISNYDLFPLHSLFTLDWKPLNVTTFSQLERDVILISYDRKYSHFTFI